MTNGHDHGPDHVVGKCRICGKPVKNKDRYLMGSYIHMWCKDKEARK